MTSFPTVIDLQAERAKRARARTDENGNASKFEPLRPFTAGDRLAVMSLPARGAAAGRWWQF